MAGKCLSASSSHVVTCAMMSLTDQAFVAPGSRTSDSERPAYESLKATHALSSCRNSCCLSTYSSFRKVPRGVPGPERHGRRGLRLRGRLCCLTLGRLGNTH